VGMVIDRSDRLILGIVLVVVLVDVVKHDMRFRCLLVSIVVVVRIERWEGGGR